MKWPDKKKYELKGEFALIRNAYFTSTSERMTWLFLGIQFNDNVLHHLKLPTINMCISNVIWFVLNLYNSMGTRADQQTNYVE